MKIVKENFNDNLKELTKISDEEAENIVTVADALAFLDKKGITD